MSDPATVSLYTEMMLARLPLGDASIWRARTTINLARALATEGARIRDSARVEALDGFMPDSATLLVEWEAYLALNADGLSDDQRRGQIIAKLQGHADPTPENLQGALEAIVPGASIWDLYLTPPALPVDIGVDLGTEQAVVGVFYMPSVFTMSTPDDGSVLGTDGSRTTGQLGRFGSSAATRFNLAAAQYVEAVWPAAVSGGRWRASFYVRAAAPCEVELDVLVDGSWSGVNTYTLGTSWQRIVIEADSYAPFDGWRFLANTAAALTLSWVRVGQHDPVIERVISTTLTAPLHAVIEYGVQREFNT